MLCDCDIYGFMGDSLLDGNFVIAVHIIPEYRM